MSVRPDDPHDEVDPDLEPAAEPADAAEQQREAWENADDHVLPDQQRPVVFDDEQR